ncbi:MAG: acyloxyacyl hydrolase [Sedimentisphaerales bacterium]|nr:acyloxyacyl hydrolase [Sedimentisphaerales bacterium]
MGKAMLCCALICLVLACPGGAGEVGDNSLMRDSTTQSKIWPEGMGNGLRTSVNEVGFALGPGIGTRQYGGSQRHDLALGHISYARLRTEVIGGQCPLRGSLEARIELLTGAQYHPEGAYLVGLTPVLRYNVATGNRWMPFVNVGVGVLLTDIGLPDLSTVFQFGPQFGGGCSYFLTDDLALTLEYRFIHISNADIETPNAGVNTHFISIGLSRYF